MIAAVLAHAVFPKVSARDAIIMSTMCREFLEIFRDAYAPPAIDAILSSTSDVLSFGLWMQRHARTLRSIAVSAVTASSGSVVYMCSMAPSLRSCRLCLERYETFSFNFLWALRDLHIDLAHCLDSRFSMAATSFPSLESLAVVAPLGGDRRTACALPDNVPRLVSLTLRHVFVEDLPAMPALEHLTMSSCRFGDEVVSHLNTLTALTSLDLSLDRMAFIPELRNLVRLKELDVSRNALSNYDELGYYDDTFTGIDELTSLTSLVLHHNFVDTLGLEDSLAGLACRLRHLDVSCTPCVDVPVFESTRHLTSLGCSCIPKNLHAFRALETMYLHGFCSDVYVPDEDAPASTVTAPPSLRCVYIDVDESILDPITRDAIRIVTNLPSVRVVGP